MKQPEAVIATLERLGGIATLGQLNQEVFRVKECEWKTKTPLASIRRIVQTNSEIYKIKPGLYGLKSRKKQNESKGIVEETAQNKNSQEIIEFNHSYYQGLILMIGNLRNLQTYLPGQDKNRFFLNERLGDISSLDKIPVFSYDNLVKRSSTIDAIWFAERLTAQTLMPHSFFEVEHSTDIQNSLLKFHDLQDFSAQMWIVADIKRRPEFDSKMNFSAFKSEKLNIKFLDYESLTKQYEREVENSKLPILI